MAPRSNDRPIASVTDLQDALDHVDGPDPRNEDEHDDALEADNDGASEGDGDADDGDADGAGEDAADEGDTAEDDDGETRAAEVAGRTAPSPRRTSDIIRQTKRERKEAEQRATEAQRRAEEAERRATEAQRRIEEAERRLQSRQTEEDAAAEAARLELMTEGERIAHYREKDRREMQQQVQGLQFQMWDQGDRSEFRQLTREDPLVAKVADKVEAEFERLKKQGSPVRREVIANLMIGELARQRSKTGNEGQRRKAAAKVRRETVQAPRARADAPAERRQRGQDDTPEARRKRLENVQL